MPPRRWWASCCQFKKRCAWRAEGENIEAAREEITAYIDRYHRRPHSGLGYRTPLEVRATWEDPFRLQKHAA